MRKDLFITIVFSFFGAVMLLGGASHHPILGLLFCLLPFTVALFWLSIENLIILMLFSLIFIPFYYLTFLNLFNVINPLTFLGVVILFKNLVQIYNKRINYYSHLTSIDFLYIIFVISALISTGNSISKLGSLNWMLYSFLTGYVIYRNLIQLDYNSGLRIIRIFIVFLFIAAFYGILELMILKKSLIFNAYLPPDLKGRLTSTIGHPLINGLIFAVAIPFNIAFIIQKKRTFYYISFLVILIALVLTYSRGSWLALLVGMFIMGILLKGRKFISFILVFLISFVVLFPLKNSIVKRIHKNENYQHSSFDIRKKSIHIAFELTKLKPFFGYGPFNAGREKERFANDPNLKRTSFEDSYLGLLVGLGWVGLSIYVFLIFTTLFKSFNSVQNASNISYKTILIACFSSFFIFSLNLSTFNFDDNRVFHFVFWFLLGLNVLFQKELIENLKKAT